MTVKPARLKWLMLSIFLITAGCEPEKPVVKQEYSPGEILSKTDAAADLQLIIRNAYKISVWHWGFKPEATPPCPPPDWKPQDVLTVNENEIWTRYHRQHWYDEKESRGGNGYWEYYEWTGRRA